MAKFKALFMAYVLIIWADWIHIGRKDVPYGTQTGCKIKSKWWKNQRIDATCMTLSACVSDVFKIPYIDVLIYIFKKDALYIKIHFKIH